MFNFSPLWCDLILFSNQFFFPTVTHRMGHNSLTDWIGCMARRTQNAPSCEQSGSNRQNLTGYVGYVVSAIDAVHSAHQTYGENGWASDWEEGKHVTRSLPFTDALRWFDYYSYASAQMSYNCSDRRRPLLCRLSAFFYNTIQWFISHWQRRIKMQWPKKKIEEMTENCLV